MANFGLDPGDFNDERKEPSVEKGRNQKDRAIFEARMTDAMLSKNHWDDHWETWKEACEYAREAIELTDDEKRRLEEIRLAAVDGNGVEDADVQYLLSLLKRAGGG